MSTISGNELSGIHLGKYIRIEGDGFVAAGKITKIQHDLLEILPEDPPQFAHGVYIHHGNSGQWFQFLGDDALVIGDSLTALEPTIHHERPVFSPSSN